jgi:demethylmenaquinone methyltransferase/2-methoxy-6-polyprenyl-1,4-benzoquinol methylase
MQKKEFVKEKFSNISNKYDLLNSILSFGIDRYWRWYVAAELANTLKALNGPVLDLCAGTLPLSKEISRHFSKKTIVSVDFCQPMLFYGMERIGNTKKNIKPVCGDALRLPFKADTFSAVTVAFGVRNFSDINKGIEEILRVLKTNGKLVILEFSNPENRIFSLFYKFYLNNVLPSFAGLISGDKDAYKYLASSINSFYKPAELKKILEHHGFVKTTLAPLTQGVVYIHTGIKR